MSALDVAVRDQLGLTEGYLLPWRIFGCQAANGNLTRMAELLTCPYREARWQCEVIGPHTRHRWSEHLQAHERAGNGWGCNAIGDGQVRVLMGDPVTGRTYVRWAGR